MSAKEVSKDKLIRTFLQRVKATRDSMNALGVQDHNALSMLKREVLGAIVNAEIQERLNALEEVL